MQRTDVTTLKVKLVPLEDLPTTTTSPSEWAFAEDTFQQDIEDLQTNVGDLDNLTTTEKTNLVGAINELNTNKVEANTAITGATHTKITYDSKGLVTAGADLQASDIPDISDTYQTKLVSGTNIKTINNQSLLGSGNINTQELPSQTGNNGKILSTDGTDASWIDIPVSDVTINSASIVSNGVAAIPIAQQSGDYGLVKLSSDSGGLVIDSSGRLITRRATDADILASPRTQINRPIVPANLDLAVKEGLGNNSLTWDDTYQSNARNTIGATQVVIREWD